MRYLVIQYVEITNAKLGKNIIQPLFWVNIVKLILMILQETQ